MPKIGTTSDYILNVKQIQDILPQRYPFLYIDRVLSFNKKKGEIACLKNVTINEHFFNGHFPGNPVLPGVIILEAMAQASILLYALMKPKLAAKRPDYLLGKAEISYRKSVTAGDQLVLEIEKDKLLDTAGMVNARASVESQTVAEARISFGVRFKHD